VTWSKPVSLDDVKLIKNVFGVTVNDVLVSALTAAFRYGFSHHAHYKHARRPQPASDPCGEQVVSSRDRSAIGKGPAHRHSRYLSECPTFTFFVLRSSFFVLCSSLFVLRSSFLRVVGLAVSLRSLDDWEMGNKVCTVWLYFPVSEEDPVVRLRTVHDRMNRLKTLPAAPIQYFNTRVRATHVCRVVGRVVLRSD
jgi:hypothetical protein